MSILKEVAQVFFNHQKRKHGTVCRSPVIKPETVSKQKTVIPGKVKPKRRKRTHAVFQISGKPKMYFVESDDKKSAFKVKWDGRKGVCSCSDYQQNHKGNGYLCSHITAVRGGKSKLSVMAQKGSGKTDDEIYTALSKDFSEDKILYRSDGLRTIETIFVINRMNEVLGVTNWNFRHSTPKCNNGEYTCNGRVDVSINGKSTFRQQTGSCKMDTGSGLKLSNGEAQTGAIQMALKKCCSLYGVAGQIYRSDR